MKQNIKRVRNLVVAVLIGLCFSADLHAQSPADDPGIGGPGSPSVGVGGDGSPVVPLNRDLSMLLIAAGIAYSYKKIKQAQVVGLK